MKYLKLLNTGKNQIGSLTLKDGNFTVDVAQDYKEHSDELRACFNELIIQKGFYVRKNSKINDKIVEFYDTAQTEDEILKSLADSISRHKFSFGRIFAVINRVEEEV